MTDHIDNTRQQVPVSETALTAWRTRIRKLAEWCREAQASGNWSEIESVVDQLEVLARRVEERQ